MRYAECFSSDLDGKVLIKAFFSTVSEGKRTYREHHHVECEISTFISGSGVYTVGNKEYSFKAGDVFVFGGDEEHCITDITSKFELLNIHFIPSMLFSSNEDMTLLKIFSARNENFTNRVDRNNPETQKISEKIISIHNELNTKNDGYVSMSKIQLFSILISLIRNYDYINKEIDLSNFESFVPVISKVTDYIHNNLEEKLSLKDIAKYVNVNPTYLSTLFKKINGISLWEYIITKRVEKAIDLLKNTNMKKLDIAFQCGFSSSSNFYKAFYNVTGKTPSHYQK